MSIKNIIRKENITLKNRTKVYTSPANKIPLPKLLLRFILPLNAKITIATITRNMTPNGFLPISEKRITPIYIKTIYFSLRGLRPEDYDKIISTIISERLDVS